MAAFHSTPPLSQPPPPHPPTPTEKWRENEAEGERERERKREREIERERERDPTARRSDRQAVRRAPIQAIQATGQTDNPHKPEKTKNKK